MSDPGSERGRLIPPDLDDRRWQDLVDEARALIPKYAPQWTDHNPSDIGITLVELFAWLVEGLIYRLNRVPEKNYVAFLNLLGITRKPATPARSLLTFTARPETSPTVPRGTQAQTQPSESQAPLVFETEAELRVAQTTVASAVRIDRPSATGGPTYTNLTGTLAPPGPGGATLDLTAGASAQLCLGFEGAVTAEFDIYVEVGRWQPPDGEATAAWVYSAQGTTDPDAWPPVQVLADRTSGLRRDGLVRISVPTDRAWAAQKPPDWPVPPASGTTPVTGGFHWIGLRIANTSGVTGLQLDLTHLLVSTVPATCTRMVPVGAPEEVGRSDGTPFQVFALRNRPLFRRPGTDAPYDHVSVTVDDTPWALVDDLEPGPAPQYRLDPVAAEIAFGNHDPTTGAGHGAIPPAGGVVKAGYRYVAAGAAGNLPAGAINTLAIPVPNVLTVHNPVSGRGGADEEPIEEAKRRAPELLRTRNRAVTAEDYEHLAREVSPEIAVVRCLTPRLQDNDNGAVWKRGDPWRFAKLLRAPGSVNLIIVPDRGRGVARPEPSPSLIQDILRTLDRRGDLTTHLHVTGARYLPIRVVVDARIFQRAIDEGRIASAAQEYEDIARRVEEFFHPVHGGRGGRGWDVGQSVFLADVYQAVKPRDEVGYIASLQLEPETPAYHEPPLGPGGVWNANERPDALSDPGPLVRVVDYELICFGSSQIPRKPTE